MKHFITLFAFIGCLQIQAQTKIVNPDAADFTKLEVVGKKSDFGYSKVYVYNPMRNDSHIYMGYYYTASQLDSIFGVRTYTQIFDDGDAVYRYDRLGILFSMTPADNMGLFSIMLVGDQYRFHVEGVEMQIGDHILDINWTPFRKTKEKIFEDGTIGRWYRTPSSDLLVVRHKNNKITEIRFDLDF